MERFCGKCGKLVSGEGQFCPDCGAPLDSAVNLSKPEQPAQSTPYVQPMQPAQPSQPAQQNFGSQTTSGSYNQSQMPNYPQTSNVSNERSEDMTVGQWVGTLLLGSCLGCVSIVLLFVWAFGDTPQPKKNWARAMLIIQLISIAIVVLFYIGMFVCLGMAGEDFSEIFAEMAG